MKQPTVHQATVFEAVMRLGSQSAAAREIGVDQGSVRTALLDYCRKTGTSFESLPRGKATTQRRTSQPAPATGPTLGERFDLVEDRLDCIEGLLRELLARPVAVAFQPSHRRKVDGGIGGRREQREAARSA